MGAVSLRRIPRQTESLSASGSRDWVQVLPCQPACAPPPLAWCRRLHISLPVHYEGPSSTQFLLRRNNLALNGRAGHCSPIFAMDAEPATCDLSQRGSPSPAAVDSDPVADLASLGASDQACKECRRRKARCNRLLPTCDLCIKYRRHCLYEKHSRTPLTRRYVPLCRSSPVPLIWQLRMPF